MAKKLQKGNGKLRGKIMEMVKRRQKTLKAASLELGLGYKQAKQVYQRYLEGGDDSLIHKNKGKDSNNRIDESLIQYAIFLYKEYYSDFGLTFAQEKMKVSEYRSRRTPRERFGELIRFDGSRGLKSDMTGLKEEGDAAVLLQ